MYEIATLRTLVLATLNTIHTGPAPTASVIADAIVHVVAATCVEPGALGSCELDAVAMAVTAEQEGALCLGAACKRGDHGRSSSTFQTMGRTPGETDLYERDLGAATRQAYAVLCAGAKQCPDSQLAPYCGGCHRRGARAIAGPRLETARALYALFRVEDEDSDETAGLP